MYHLVGIMLVNVSCTYYNYTFLSLFLYFRADRYLIKRGIYYIIHMHTLVYHHNLKKIYITEDLIISHIYYHLRIRLKEFIL